MTNRLTCNFSERRGSRVDEGARGAGVDEAPEGGHLPLAGVLLDELGHQDASRPAYHLTWDQSARVAATGRGLGNGGVHKPPAARKNDSHFSC